MKEGLESEPGNDPPSTTPKKVEVMVKVPFSKSQSGSIERQSDKRGGERNAISQMSPVVIFGGWVQR